MLQLDEKKSTVPSNFSSIPQLNPTVSSAPTSSPLFAAPSTPNPFLLAALLMQQNQVSSQLPNTVQSFAALLPYLQQNQNGIPNDLLMQNLLLQQMTIPHLSAASPTVIQQQQQNSQQWIPAASAASASDNVSSPVLSTSEETLSVLSESSHISPRPRDIISPDKDAPLVIPEDEYMIESLIEARKGLSEKETIAVAVLAGMAGYQR